LDAIDPIAWELALRVVSDPGILRRALLDASLTDALSVISSVCDLSSNKSHRENVLNPLNTEGHRGKSS
jgi:hypothetical protein